MRALLLAVFSAMLGLGIVSPLMPIYAKDLGATTLILGIIYSSFSTARTIFTPIVGFLSDRLGRKFFILTGLALYSILSIFYMVARTPEDLVVIRFFHGLSSAMVVPSAMAYVSQLAPKGEEGRTISSFNIAFLTGMGFGPFLGGVVKDIFGLRFAFAIMAFLTALAFILALPLPNLKDRTNFRVKAILNRCITSLMIFRFSTAVRMSLMIAFFPVLISYLKGYEIGAIVSAVILSNAISQKLFSGLVDRFDRVLIATISGLASTIIFIVLPFSDDFYRILALALVMGIFNGLATCSACAIAIELGRTYGHGAVMGLYNTAMSLAMMTTPVIAGFIADKTDIPTSFVALGFLSMTCLFIFHATISKR
ncbi:MFS transporter [Archaeoglobus profundus]|uniref:Major facilitator superfamily MFS_1 n=1 Tax=Archaeoglobus profundus (strain DSM 5631 / JCM 9629 / NBRC 100127 / Av18) TaxID=572546 RepID=D2RH71_ARCPA|nr:MFS transporter [Archaeoglobus profundus]ADB57646.1 major facilitator superfamily MFS_1 [Archaeoglobus profundus DSM 5631]